MVSARVLLKSLPARHRMSANLTPEIDAGIDAWIEWVCRDRPIKMSKAQAVNELLAKSLAAERGEGRPPAKK